MPDNAEPGVWPLPEAAQKRLLGLLQEQQRVNLSIQLYLEGIAAALGLPENVALHRRRCHAYYDHSAPACCRG